MEFYLFEKNFEKFIKELRSKNPEMYREIMNIRLHIDRFKEMYENGKLTDSYLIKMEKEIPDILGSGNEEFSKNIIKYIKGDK